MISTQTHPRYWLIGIYMALSMLMSGCKEEPKAQANAVALGLVAYNYTGRYISDYKVDGYSGGGVTETGSGDVCCLSFSPDSKIPFTVHVVWTFGREEDATGNIIKMPENHSADVQVGATISNTIGMPHKPMLFETHFLPDGTVKAYVTEANSDAYFTTDGKPIRPMP